MAHTQQESELTRTSLSVCRDPALHMNWHEVLILILDYQRVRDYPLILRLGA